MQTKPIFLSVAATWKRPCHFYLILPGSWMKPPGQCPCVWQAWSVQNFIYREIRTEPGAVRTTWSNAPENTESLNIFPFLQPPRPSKQAARAPRLSQERKPCIRAAQGAPLSEWTPPCGCRRSKEGIWCVCTHTARRSWPPPAGTSGERDLGLLFYGIRHRKAVSCCGHRHTKHNAFLPSNPLGTGVWLQLLAGKGTQRYPKNSLPSSPPP